MAEQSYDILRLMPLPLTGLGTEPSSTSMSPTPGRVTGQTGTYPFLLFGVGVFFFQGGAVFIPLQS